MVVKVFSKVESIFKNEPSKHDCGQGYFMVDANNHDEALGFIRNEYDPKAIITQSAEQLEIDKGCVLLEIK